MKTLLSKPVFFATTLFVLCLISPSIAAAATYTWSLPTGGSWNTAANWSTTGYTGATTANATLPTVADTVIFTANTTGTITLDAAQACGTLTLDSAAGGLTITPGAAAKSATITNKLASATVVTMTSANTFVVGDIIDMAVSTPDGGIDRSSATVATVTAAQFTINQTAGTVVATAACNGIARVHAANFALTVGGTISHTDTNNTTVTITCPIVLTGATNIGVVAGTGKLDFARGSGISGNFAITINGAPTAGLGAAAGAVEFLNDLGSQAGLFNSFTGAITINAGARLNFLPYNGTFDQFALGTGAKTITWNGGTLGLVTTSANPAATTKSFSIGAAGGTLDTNALTFQLDDAGQLAGVGGGTLTKVNTGTFFLGAQSFAVGAATTLVVKAGLLQLNTNNTVFGTTAANTITLDGGSLSVIAAGSTYPNNIIVASTGTITNSTTANAVTTFSGNLTINASASLTLANAAANTSLVFTGAGGNTFGNAATLTANENVTFNGVTAYTTAASLAGTANIKFSGDATGTATITKTGAGALVYNGTQSSTTAAFVINGGRLAGSGTFASPVTIASGLRVDPGDFTTGFSAVGTLTFGGNFSYTGASQFQLGTSSDALATTAGSSGNITLNGNAFTLSAATGFNPASTYTIIQTGGTGTISGATTATISMPGYTFVTNAATATNALIVGPFTSVGAAAQLNWKGGSGIDLATAANWVEGIAPSDPSGPFELIFGSTGAGALSNSMPAATSVHALTFTAGGYTLGGNSLAILADASSTNSPVGTGISVANGAGNVTVGAALVLTNSSANIAVGTNSSLLLSNSVSQQTINVGLSKSSNAGVSGLGTLTLSGANSYAGGFTQNGGTLNVNSATAFGTTAGALAFNAGTLDNTSGIAVTVGANPITLGSDVTFTGTSALTFGGTLALGASRTFTINASTLSFNGIISGATFGITKEGVGTLAFGAAVTNTYTGATTINNGTLSIASGPCIGSTTNPAILLQGRSAALPATLSYSAATTTSLAASRNIFLGNVSNANIIDVASGGTFQVDTTTFVMSGGVASPGVAFIKTGAGAFSSNNGNATSLAATFLGDIRILNGTLTSCQSSTTAINTQLFGTGTIFLGDTSGSNATTINPVGTITGTGPFFGNALQNNLVVVAGNAGLSRMVCTNTGASYAAAGAITMNKDFTILGPGTTTATQFNFTHSGALTGTGILTVKNNGATTASTEAFIFKNASGFTGSFNVATGTTGNTYVTDLQLGATNSFPATCAIALNGTGTDFSTNGFNNTIGSITGAAGSIIRNNSATASTLTIGNDNTSYTYAGTIVNGSTAALNIAKAGTGTITLSGVNTYTGTTVLNANAGSWIINGAQTTTGLTTVNSGAILGGVGSTTGSVTVAAGGILNPGPVAQTAGPFSLKSAGLTLTAAATGATTNFRLNGASAAAASGTWPSANNDYYDFTPAGAQVIQGNINVTGLGGLLPSPSNVYRLFTTTGTAPTLGTLGTNLFLNMPAGYSGTLAVNGLNVELTVISDGSILTWNGGTSGDISVATNWTPNAVPSSTSNLLFTSAGGNQANLVNNGVSAVNAITFSGGTYTLSSGTQTTLALPASTSALTPLNVLGGTQTINTKLTFAAPVAGTGIAVSSGATLTLAGGGNTLGSTTLLTINSPGTTTINSVISGTALSFPSTSTGTVTLGGANTYTGSTTIGGGTVRIANAGAFGTTGPVTVSSGATLDLFGLSGTLAVPINMGGIGVSGSGALNNSVAGAPVLGGTLTLTAATSIAIANGTVTVQGNVVGGGFGLTVNNTGAVLISGNINNTMTTLTKSGSGTLTLTGSNAYTGMTSVTAGTLAYNSVATVGSGNSALGAPSSAANGMIALGAATLQYIGSTASTTDRSIGLTVTGATLDASGTGSVTFLGGVTGPTFNLTLTGTGTGSVGGIATTTGTVTKISSGAWNLNGLNTYTGATLAENGTLTYSSGGTQTLSGALNVGFGMFTVSTKALTTNVATITTTAAHGFYVGMPVAVRCNPADAVFDGTYTITSIPSTTTFTYARSNADVASVASGGGVTSGGVVNLGVSNSTALTFNGLVTVRNQSAANTLVIGTGSTLTWPGGLTMGLDVSAQVITLSTSLAVSGGGSLAITGGSVVMGVSQGTVNANNNSQATLDLSGLAGFSATVTNFFLGSGNTCAGTLTLANTSNTIACTTMTIGNSGGNNGVGSNSITLGAGTNTIFADALNIGLGKIGGTLSFASQTAGSPGTLVLAPKTVAGTALIIGSNTGTGTGAVFTGTVDLRGHASTVVGGAMQLGICSNTSTGSTTGILNFDTGNMSVTTIDMANKSGAGGTGVATGTITLGGGTLAVTGGSFKLATEANASSSVGTFNLNGGTLITSAPITDGGGTTNTIFNFNGGTLRPGAANLILMSGLDSANVLDGGVTLDTSGFTAFIQQNLLAGGTGVGGVTKVGTGTLTLAGANTYTGPTTVNAGTLAVTGSLVSGSAVTVNNTATLAGTGVVNGFVTMKNGTTLSPGSGGAGTLTLNGTVSLTTPGLSFDLGLPGAGNAGGGLNDLVTSAAGAPTLDFGPSPSTITITPRLGFGVGTYTLLSGYTFANAINLPQPAPISGVTMNTTLSGNSLLLNVTHIPDSPSRVTWTGANGTHNWSDPLNWTPNTTLTIGGPYELLFPDAPTSTDFAPVDNIPSLTIHSIIIDSATAYSMTGAVTALTIDGAGTQSGVALNVIRGTGHTFGITPLVWSTTDQIITVAAGGLVLNSNITNSTFNTTFANAADVSYNGVLGSGGGGLSKGGTGKLTLTNTNTYSGVNQISSGTLSVSTAGQLGTGTTAAVLFPSGGTGALQLTGAGTFSTAVKTITLNGTGTIDVPNVTDSATFSGGGFVGAGGITKIGDGTLNMSVANTFTGPVTVNAGTFLVGNATALGAAASTAVNFGPGSTGTLALNGNSVTVISLNSDPTTPGTPIIQNGNAGTAATLTVNNTTTASTFAGVIQNGSTASIAITKSGTPAVLTLSGTNTHTGVTTITSGTLRLGNNFALGAITNTLTTTAGTLDLNGFSPTIANLTGNAANTITDSSSVAGTSTLTVTGLTATLANLITDGANGRVVAVAVGNANAGIANLSNTGNTFSGGFTLIGTASGSRLDLVAATSGNLGGGTAGAIISGPFGRGPIIIGQNPTDKAGIYIPLANTSIFNDIVCNTTLGTDRPGIRVDGIGCVIAGKITANQSDALFSTNGTGAITLTGQITGNFGLALDASFGTALTVTLADATANPNNYIGNTTINSNAAVGRTMTLVLGATEQIPNGTGKGNVIVNTNGTGIGKLNLAGFNETINGLSGNGTVDGTSGTPTLTLGDGNATASFSGAIVNTAGTLNLVKIGSGTETLAGINTFGGTSIINGGTILLTGTLPNNAANAITVNNSATLSFGHSDAFATFQGIVSVPITINAGGTVTNSGAFYNTLGPVTLSGGTLTSIGGLNATFPSWGLSGLVTVNGTVTSTMSASGASSGFALGEAGTLSNSVAILIAAHGAATGPDLVVSGALFDGQNSAGSGALPSALSFSGAGELALSGNNTFTGGVTVNSGTLDINSSTALGATASALTIASPSTLDNTSGLALTLTSGNAVSINADFVFKGSNNLNLGTGLVTLAANQQATVTAGQLTLGGNIGPATSILTKAGNGTLILTGASVVTPITVNAGILGGGFTTASTITLHGGSLEPGIGGTPSTITSTNASGTVVYTAASSLNFDCASPGINDMILGNGGGPPPTFDFSTFSNSLRINAKSGFTTGHYILIDNVTFPTLPPSTPSNTVAGVIMTLSVVPGSQGGTNQSLVLDVALAGGTLTWTGQSPTTNHLWSDKTNWSPQTTITSSNGPWELVFPDSGVSVDNQSWNNIAGGVNLHDIIMTANSNLTIKTIAGGGTATVDSVGTTPGVAISVLGAGTLNIDSSVTLAWSGQSTMISVSSGGLAMSGNIVNGAFDTTFVNAVDISMSGVLGNGSGGLIKSGAGTLTLSGTNTFTGVNTINAGTLSVSSGAGLGANATGSGVTFATGGTGTLQAIGTVSMPNMGIALNSDAIIDVTGSNSLTVGSGIAGSSLLTKIGTGTLNINTAATNSGGVVLNAGVLGLGNPGALGNTSGTFTINGGSLDATSAVVLNSYPIVVAADFTFVGTNPLTLQGMDFGAATRTITTTANTLTFNGIVTGSGGVGLTKAGAGTLILGAANAFPGPVTINAGTVALGHAAGLGPVGTATLAFGINSTGKFQTQAFSPTIVSLNSDVANPGTPIVENGSGTPETLTVNDTASNIFLGVIQNGSGGGTLSVSKSGAGNLSLGGVNTYTGLTTLDQGVLAFTGGTQTLGALTLGSLNTITTTGTLDLTSSSVTFNGGLSANYNSAAGSTITVGAGKTMTVNGNFIVGSSLSNGATTLTMNGGGSLVVSSPAGNFSIGNYVPVVTNAFNRASLNMSGLGSATVDVTTGTIQIGQTGDNNGGLTNPSLLLLPPNATLNAASLTVGASGNGNPSTLTMSSGATIINADTFNIGTGGRDPGVVNFAGAAGTLKLRSRADPVNGRANLNIGTGTQTTGYGANNTLTLTGHASDLLIATLAIGNESRSGVLSSTLSFDTGTLDCTTCKIGFQTGTTSTGSSMNAALIVSGGSVIIGSGGLEMGNNTGTGALPHPVNGTLTITGGIVSIANSTTLTGAIKMSNNSAAAGSGTTATSTINLNGGTLAIAGNILKGVATSPSVATINFNGGTLRTDAAITVSGLSAVSVLNGGGTIDTNGFAPTISQVLTFSTVTSNTVTAGGAYSVAPTGMTYTAPTTPGGVTATGVVVTTGATPNIAVSGIIITNPGSGYTSAPAISFTGGTSTTAAAATAGITQGNGILTKVGAGSLTLSGANQYTGGTVIQAGTLIVTNEGAAGAGGSLGLVPASATPNNVILNGGTLQNSGTLTISANRGIGLGLNGGTISHAGARFTVNGIVADQVAGAGALTVVGTSNDLVLGGFNTYSGGTNLNTTGALPLSLSSTGIPGNPTNGPLGVGVLNLNGGQIRSGTGGPFTLQNNVAINANTTFYSAGAGTDKDLILNGNVTLVGGTRTLTLQTSPAAGNSGIFIDGVISDGGNGYGLTVVGTAANILTLDANNTFSGTTTITSGTLALGSNGTSGSLGLGNVVDNGTLKINRSDSITLSNAISGSGGLAQAGSGTTILFGANSYSGVTSITGGTLSISNANNIGNAAATNTIVIAGGILQSAGGSVNLGATRAIALGVGGGTVDVTGSSVLTVPGVVSGASNLTKTSSGTLILSGNNLNSGALNLLGGVTNFFTSGSLGTGTAITFDNGALQYGSGNTADISTRTVTLNAGGGTIDTNNNNVAFTAPIGNNGPGGLTKLGLGTLTLAGTNSYNGATIIGSAATHAPAGAIVLASLASVNGTVTVNGSGVASPIGLANALRGTGAVGDTITTVSSVAGDAVVWPGVSTVVSNLSTSQTLSGASVNLSAGGKLAVVLNNANSAYQTLNLGGTLTLAGTSNLSLAFNASPTAGLPVVIVNTAPGGISNAFNSVTSAGVYGVDYDVIYTDGTTQTVSPPGGAVLNAPSKQIIVRFNSTSVTPVKIDSFTAATEGAGTLLTWHSVSEFQNAGYNLHRRVPGSSDWTKVNSTLIAGRLTNADEHTYRFYDWVSSGQFEYKLESISVKGEREDFALLAGPVTLDDVGSDAAVLTDGGIAAAVTSVDAEAQLAQMQAMSAKFPAFVLENKGPITMPLAPAVVRQIVVDDSATASTRSAVQPILSASNVAMGARWFTGNTASSLGSSSFVGVKVQYVAPGVLAIPQTAMPAGFDINHVAVQREGRTLTALAIRGGVLFVYAPGYSDDYTDKDVLFLRATSAPTVVSGVPQAQGLFGSNAAVNTTSTANATVNFHDVYFDYNTAYRPYSYAPWFSSQYLTGGSDQTFTIATPNASGGSASLTVTLWSLTSSEGTSVDHALQVLVNGQPAGQTQWSGGGKMMQLTFQIPSGFLKASGNALDLITPNLTGVDSQVCFVHSFAVNYTRALDGSQPVTITNSADGASAMFELTNVPSANPWVLDTRFTDRVAPVPFEAQAQADGTFKIRFVAGIGGTAQYRVIPSGQENAPIAMSKRAVKALKATTYLATGPIQFSAGVQPLLMMHSKDGLRGAFADQEQLFDYYNYGRYGPAGIQSAVRATRPQFLLLVGRTTYDYHNYSGANVDPLCPAFLVSTSFWAQTTSDSQFGDLGRGYPEVAIGRLPVNDTTDLAGAVKHIVNYKGFAPSGIRAQATADSADPAAGDFAAQADILMAAHPDMTWERNYLGVTAPTYGDANAAMNAAANGGADLLIYEGHGNASSLGGEVGPGAPKILDTTSVQQWTGNVVFLQGTCNANWMAKDVQNYHSIAIQALTQPQGGISAGIGTSTYMTADVTSAFLDQLLRNADTHGTTWGQALLQAQQWAFSHSSNSFYTDLGQTEQLFGDPAMPVFQKSSSVPAGTSKTVVPTPAAPSSTTPVPAQGTF